MSDAISTLRPGIAAFVAGTLSALLFVAVLSNSLGGMILFGMAQLPLYLVALSLGPGFAAAAAVWAFGVLVPSVSLVGALGFLVWAAIPVLAVTATALRSQRPNPGLLVLALTGIVITAFIAADVVNAGVSGGLEARIRGWMAPMLMHGASKAAIRQINGLLLFVPSMIGCFALLISVGNGILAQGALSRFRLNRWPSPRMASLTIPRWVSIAFVVTLTAGIAGAGEVRFVGSNLAILIAVPLMFGGFAALHDWTSRHPTYWAVLPGVYAMCLVSGGWPIPVIVALGIVDQWFGIRQRQAKPTGEKYDG